MATLTNLIAQFEREWRAGNNARVQLECHAGQAWLSLHLHVQHPPPHQDARPHRQPGPSRLRRRARRAALRAKANAETNTAEVAVAVAFADTDLSTEKVVDVNVNNVEETKTEEVADITEKVIDPNSTAVIQAVSHEAPEPVQPHPAVQAAQQHSGQLSAQARPWPHCAKSSHVRDVFCPDVQYQPIQPEPPSNQCKLCGKTFGSGRALTSHERRDH